MSDLWPPPGDCPTLDAASLDVLDDFALLAPGYVFGAPQGEANTPWLLLEGVGADTGLLQLWLLPFERRAAEVTRLRAASARWVQVALPAAARLDVRLDTGGAVSAIEQIRQTIAAGDVYQVNYTLRAQVTAAHGSQLLGNLCATARPRFAAWVKHGGEEHVSASPELLVRVDGRHVEVEPMKGTAPADATQRLLESTKDAAELAMITDLLRDDLHRLCERGSVRVRDARRLVSLSYAVQTVADVEGTLRAGVTLTDVLGQVHPGGSVTGAPRTAALACIRALEGSPRGLYCGALGLVDGGQATFALTIRTASRVGGDRWVYGVGGGMTWDSDAQAELEEMRVKLGALGAQR